MSKVQDIQRCESDIYDAMERTTLRSVCSSYKAKERMLSMHDLGARLAVHARHLIAESNADPL